MKQQAQMLSAWVLLVLPVAAGADIHNGDFERGGEGWTPSVGTNWTITFPAIGGHPTGYAQIESPGGFSGGSSGIFQLFDCGTAPPGVCLIMFDYRLIPLNAGISTGRILVIVDGQIPFTSPPGGNPEWGTGYVLVPCGHHAISLILQVDAGHNRWQASFDNAHARCFEATLVEQKTWGEIKRLFRAAPGHR